MNSKDYRLKAKELLQGKEKPFAIAAIIFYAINYSVTFLSQFIGEFVNEPIIAMLASTINLAFSLLVTPVLGFGMVIISMKVIRGMDIVANDIFAGFKRWNSIVLLNFLRSIYIMLYMLLLIVPGILKSLSYAMSDYILADNPDMNPGDVLKKSEEMMKGHRWEYFKLEFSFVGWYILSVFTLGILLLWVVPRNHTAIALFYEKLKTDTYGAEPDYGYTEPFNQPDYNYNTYSQPPFEAEPIQPEINFPTEENTIDG